MKKKTLLIALMLTLACFASAFIVGCGSHEHDYSPNTVEATCKEQGYTEYTCACGDSYKSDYTEKKNHDIETFEAKPSTCSVKGYKAYEKCKNCDYTTFEELPLESHQTEVTEEVAGNCKTGEQGYKLEECKNCDYSKKTKIEPKHDWEFRPAQSANCYQEGWNPHSVCTICGKTSNQVNIVPKKHGKLVDVPEKQSTCGEKGYYAHKKCEICGEEFGKVEMPLFDNHSLATAEAKEPTCYEPGNYSYEYCTVKGCTYSTKQEIPPLAHDCVSYPGKQATCTTSGYKAYEKCINPGCNYSSYEEIGPLGHDEVSVTGKEPNCYSSGYEDYVYCTRCSYTTYQEKPPLDHDLKIVEREEASCLQVGHESYYQCKREGCKYTEGYIEIPKLEHSFKTNSLGQLQCEKCETVERILDILVGGVPQYKLYYSSSISTEAGWLNSELKKYVGWEFSKQTIVYPNFDSSRKVICLGHNDYSRSAGVEYYNTRETAFNITTIGNTIFVAGPDSAMKAAVYELLNVLIGYEKYSIYANNLGEQVAFVKKSDISLGVSQIEREINPDVQYVIAANSGNTYDGSMGATVQGNASMGVYFGSVTSNGWGDNDDGITESKKYHVAAGHNTLGFYPLARFNDQTRNPSTYHPEWFAKDSTGKVFDDPKQVCFNALWNDPQALVEAMKVVKFNKSWKYITISNMDTTGDCECKECYNDWGYEYFKFLNALGERMANDPETSHMILKGWLYKINSTTPPLDSNGRPRITLRDNVQILFAFDFADYYEGFSQRDRALLEKWGKVVPEMHFWTYCFKPNYSMFFFDDFTKKQEAFEVMAKYGALALYDEGSKPAPQTTNFSALRVYINSRLSINSGIKMSDKAAKAYYESITQEFFENYFGAGATGMRKVFELQKERAQYMHDNWNTGDKLYNKSFIETGIYNTVGEYFQTQITPTNETGNNRVGTYSSWTTHTLAYYYCPLTGKNEGNHGNRSCYSVVYTKQDFRNMLSWIDEAVKAIKADSSISTSQKEILINRTELEKIGVLYQFMFIFDNQFAIGNKTLKTAREASDLTGALNATDLSAIGVSSVEEATQLYADLCRKYKLYSANATTLQNLISGWNYKHGWNIQ